MRRVDWKLLRCALTGHLDQPILSVTSHQNVGHAIVFHAEARCPRCACVVAARFNVVNFGVDLRVRNEMLMIASIGLWRVWYRNISVHALVYVIANSRGTIRTLDEAADAFELADAARRTHESLQRGPSP